MLEVYVVNRDNLNDEETRLTGEWVVLPLTDRLFEQSCKKYGGDEKAIIQGICTDIPEFILPMSTTFRDANELADRMYEWDDDQMFIMDFCLKKNIPLQKIMEIVEDRKYWIFENYFEAQETIVGLFKDKYGIPEKQMKYFDGKEYTADFIRESTDLFTYVRSNGRHIPNELYYVRLSGMDFSKWKD